MFPSGTVLSVLGERLRCAIAAALQAGHDPVPADAQRCASAAAQLTRLAQVDADETFRSVMQERSR